MAIMKLTAFNGGLKGKISGTIFQGSPFGQVARNKMTDAVAAGAKLTKADAGRIIKVQKNITDIATNWRDLSSAERAGWNAGASGFPFKNKFGDLYTASGFQVYMSLNMALANAGLATLNVIPSPGTIVPAPSFTCDVNSMSGNFEVDNLTIPAGYTCTLYGTYSFSKGKKPQPGFFKALYVFQVGDTFPFNLGNYWTDQFGPVPAHGNVWFRLDIVNNATGQKGIPYYYQYAW